MILVTGASGHVGSELVEQLAAAGVPVRAMSRRPEKLTVPDGVQTIYGDCDDPDSLWPAFDGVEQAFLMSAEHVGSTAEPTHERAMVAAAQQAGVKHLVKLSVYFSDSSDSIGRWHLAAEKAVIDSGIEWTMLRPGRFMSNALHWAPMIRGGDVLKIAFAHRPAASIDPADIAAVACAALTTAAPRNVAYQLSGPQALTPAEEVAIIGVELGRDLRVEEPPMDQVRAGLLRSGMSEQAVDEVLSRTLDSDVGTEVHSTVEDLTGRPARTFAQWVQAHRADFGG